MNYLSLLTISFAGLSLLCLLVLHVVSPEFKPSWRMISEYAMGKHKGLLTTFFYSWGLSSIFLSILLWERVSSLWGMIGVILLFISAIGEIMGGLFDVKHKHHGLAALLGVPTFPIAALLIGYNLIQSPTGETQVSEILISSHATWISFVIMGITMAIMMAGFKNSGIQMGPNVEPPKCVPSGVIALAGYANRLLVICYVSWLIVIAGNY
ncbi:MAG TPA: DUF998 domain-containing protein [Chryseolinea sp.]|nr:DUF998 domain-containing protein [Chryseolinea sp.]